MSGQGRPTSAAPAATGIRVAIVLTEWNSEITTALRDRALAAAAEAGATVERVVTVAGAVELPLIAQQLASNHDAVVALGAVIKGGTPHFEYVCDAVTYGLTRVSLDTSVPVGNGVLTCFTMEQAWERAGGPGSSEDKGAEAMTAALSSAVLLRDLRRPAGKVGF